MDRFDMLFNDDYVLENYLAQNPNLTTDQIDLLYFTFGVDVRELLAEYSKLTDEQFNRLFNDSAVDKNSLAQNPHLTTEQIDLLYSQFGEVAPSPIDSQNITKNLAAHPKLTDEQFNRFFNDSDVDKDYLALNTNLTTEQIDLLSTAGVNTYYLAQMSKPTAEQFNRFFNDSDVDKNSLAKNSHLTPEQIDLLYGYEGVDGDYLAGSGAKLTDEQFNRLFNDSDVGKDYLAMNPNLTTEQIDLLYSREDVNQKYLLPYSKLTDEQFMRFFNDEDVDKNYLALNPSINPLPLNKWQAGIFNWSW